MKARLWLIVAAFVVLAASCAPGTEGIVITAAEPDETDPYALVADGDVIVDLPHIPAIALPDLSSVGEYDDLLQDRLGGLSLQPVDGVEVVSAECEHGDVVYHGDESSDLFDSEDFAADSFVFQIDPDTGAAAYSRTDAGVQTFVTTNGDGSGTFVEEGRTRHLSIEAEADSSGRYYASEDNVTTTVEADADGAGVYYRQAEDSLTTITISNDGSGALFNETPTQLLTVDARSDGSGDLFLQTGNRTVTLRIRPDGTWELSDSSFAEALTIKVNLDGSGQLRQRGTGTSLKLDFDTNGATVLSNGGAGPTVILPETPEFIVADRFPPLGTLATISPPCATVLRFDSALLFEIDKAEVLPDAAAVLAEVAPALIEADRAIEINGHTDANGSDEYNQRLSEARAQAVADALIELGVDVNMTVTGFGESQPVAPNYRDDGSDDEAGQRGNRRVELVIHEQ